MTKPAGMPKPAELGMYPLQEPYDIIPNGLAQVISLVGWLKLVKSFFFLHTSVLPVPQILIPLYMV